ncbi:TrkH family potassium uptake protein [Caldisericum sp.]|uniref:TrkH family potassium uptake protein n=1 Tax=Caldisericum sp. TaxID=2499687 RepID=UPI003D0CAB02
MERVINIDDLKVVLYYTGRITIIVGLIMIIPLIAGILFTEWPAVIDFLFSIALSLVVGYLFMIIGRTHYIPRIFHAMTIAAFSWIIAMILAAVPYYLSGHMKSFLDACFDTMSGFTTTGLILIQDLEHVSVALNTWRHLVTYTGGQGIAVLALTFLITPSSYAYKIMIGEGKEQVLPNVKHTASQIWKVSNIYLLLGTIMLAIVAYKNGIRPQMAIMHGMWIFMSAWSTGGFAPYSQNILYYHSVAFYVISLVFAIIGSMNFATHYAIWSGNFKEIFKNIELKSFSITLTLTSFVAIAALGFGKIYKGASSLFNMVFFQMVSAHTTTGLSTIYSASFLREWNELALLAAITAMAIGGSASSTAGGFKGIRVGIIFKAIIREIRNFVAPENAVITSKIHHIRDIVLEDSLVKSAALIIVLYAVTYFLGALVGVAYGYPFIQSLFESVSAASNVGLSIGVTSVTMPTLLKVVYIFEMWIGRLEFISVLVFISFIFKLVSLRGLIWK